MIFDFKIKTASQLAELKNFLLVYLPKQVNLANTSKNDDYLLWLVICLQ
jgi:hypothetical protein